MTKHYVGLFILSLLLIFILGITWVPLMGQRTVAHPILQGETPYKIVFFGFSTCPHVCPVTLSRLAKLDEVVMSRHADVIYVEIIKHGDDEAAHSYARSFHKGFIGVAPEKAELEVLSSIFGLNINLSPKVPQHQGRLYVIKKTKETYELFKTYNALKFSNENLLKDIRFKT